MTLFFPSVIFEHWHFPSSSLKTEEARSARIIYAFVIEIHVWAFSCFTFIQGHEMSFSDDDPNSWRLSEWIGNDEILVYRRLSLLPKIRRNWEILTWIYTEQRSNYHYEYLHLISYKSLQTNTSLYLSIPWQISKLLGHKFCQSHVTKYAYRQLLGVFFLVDKCPSFVSFSGLSGNKKQTPSKGLMSWPNSYFFPEWRHFKSWFIWAD